MRSTCSGPHLAHTFVGEHSPRAPSRSTTTMVAASAPPVPAVPFPPRAAAEAAFPSPPADVRHLADDAPVASPAGRVPPPASSSAPTPSSALAALGARAPTVPLTASPRAPPQRPTRGFLVKQPVNGHMLSHARRRLFILHPRLLQWYEDGSASASLRGEMELGPETVVETRRDALGGRVLVVRSTLRTTSQELVLTLNPGDTGDLSEWEEAIRRQGASATAPPSDPSLI